MIEMFKGKISSKNKPFLNRSNEIQQSVSVIPEGSNSSVKLTLFGFELVSKLQNYNSNENIAFTIIKRPAYDNLGRPIVYINVKEIVDESKT